MEQPADNTTVQFEVQAEQVFELNSSTSALSESTSSSNESADNIAVDDEKIAAAWLQSNVDNNVDNASVSDSDESESDSDDSSDESGDYNLPHNRAFANNIVNPRYLQPQDAVDLVKFVDQEAYPDTAGIMQSERVDELLEKACEGEIAVDNTAYKYQIDLQLSEYWWDSMESPELDLLFRFMEGDDISDVDPETVKRVLEKASHVNAEHAPDAQPVDAQPVEIALRGLRIGEMETDDMQGGMRYRGTTFSEPERPAFQEPEPDQFTQSEALEEVELDDSTKSKRGYCAIM